MHRVIFPIWECPLVFNRSFCFLELFFWWRNLNELSYDHWGLCWYQPSKSFRIVIDSHFLILPCWWKISTSQLIYETLTREIIHMSCLISNGWNVGNVISDEAGVGFPSEWWPIKIPVANCLEPKLNHSSWFTVEQRNKTSYFPL